MRQQQRQRDEQDHLAQHGDEQRDASLPETDEHALRRVLDAEDAQARRIDAQAAHGQLDERLVVGEQADEDARKQLDERAVGERHGERGEEQILEGLAHAVELARAIVEAHQRLHAVGIAHQRRREELDDARDDRHRADVQVAAVGHHAAVEHDLNGAFGEDHRKRRDAQRHRRAHDGQAEADLPGTQPYLGAPPRQERDDPDAGATLGDDGGQRRAAHAQAQHEDEQRIERDIERRADDHGDHRLARVALRGDERIEAEDELDKRRAQQIDGEIVRCVGQRVSARAERRQQRRHRQLEDREQHHGGAQQHERRDAENALRALAVVFAQLDGGKRRAARAEERGKGGDQRDDREGQPDAGERERADALDAADVDAVDHIVEHVDRLRDHGGQRQTEHQRADRIASEVRLPGLRFHCIPLLQRRRPDGCRPPLTFLLYHSRAEKHNLSAQNGTHKPAEVNIYIQSKSA